MQKIVGGLEMVGKTVFKLYLTIFLFGRVFSANQIREVDVYKFASGVGKAIVDFFMKTTKAKVIEQSIQNDLESGLLKSRAIDLKLSLDVFSSRIQNEFDKKRYGLKKLSEFIEKRTNEVKRTSGLKIPEEYPYEGLLVDNLDREVAINRKFSLEFKVNMTKSFIILPSNVNYQDPANINMAAITKGIDEIFKTNYYDNAFSYFQYFGSEEGFFRIHPGFFSFNTRLEIEKQSLYDCRRISWYIDASSPMKHLIIVIDMTGSMSKENLHIATVATVRLLSTLSQKDLFNIILFSDEYDGSYRFLTPCSDGLLQAHDRNKEVLTRSLLQFIKKKPPSNSGNPKAALMKAYKILLDKRYVNRTCSKLIALISDEVDEIDPSGNFKQFMKSQQVMIISLLIGRKTGPRAFTMAILANLTQGTIIPLPDSNSASIDVYKYMSAVRMKYAPTSTTYFTTVYVDIRKEKKITLSRPVFKNSTPTSLIGVVAADFPILLFEGLIAKFSMRPFSSRVIMIERFSGFVVIDSEFPWNSFEKLSLYEIPTIFLNEIVSSNEITIREIYGRILSNENSSSEAFDLKVNFVRSKYRVKTESVLLTKFDVRDTPYVTISLHPTKFNETLFVDINTLGETFDVRTWIRYILENDGRGNITVEGWRFCNINSRKSINMPATDFIYPDAIDLADEFEKNGIKNCRATEVYNLLYCSYKLYNVSTEIIGFIPDARNVSFAIITLFGGVSLVQSNMTQNFLSNENMAMTYYKAALDYAFEPIPTVLILINHENDDFNLNLSYAMRVHERPWMNPVFVGVIAITIKVQTLASIIEKYMESLPACKYKMCHDWYILDDTAHVVYSSISNAWTGKFFGEQNSDLFNWLVELNVYEMKSYSNPLAECPPEISAAINNQQKIKEHLLNPTILTLLSIIGSELRLTEGMGLLLLTSSWTLLVSAERCMKVSETWTLSSQNISISGVIMIEKLTYAVKVEHIKGTNMILLSHSRFNWVQSEKEAVNTKSRISRFDCSYSDSSKQAVVVGCSYTTMAGIPSSDASSLIVVLSSNLLLGPLMMVMVLWILR